MISVDAPRRALGRDTAIFFVPEETRSGVYFTERAFSKTRILVPFFGGVCGFGESYQKNGKTSERPAESASAAWGSHHAQAALFV